MIRTVTGKLVEPTIPPHVYCAGCFRAFDEPPADGEACPNCATTHDEETRQFILRSLEPKWGGSVE